MSNATGASKGPGFESGGFWHRRALQRSRALARTYLLSSNSVPPLPPPRLSGALRLPLLVAADPLGHKTTMAPLSTSEASIYTPGEKAVLEEFSLNRCSAPQHRQPPRPLLCKTCNTEVWDQSYRPVYTHFSSPIRPAAKLAMPCPKRKTLSTEPRDLRPFVVQYQQTPQGGALTVQGKPCRPSPPAPLTAPASAPARTQLHIFLPMERAGELNVGDNESVDEGFMDELESKVTSLNVHQGLPKTSRSPTVQAADC